MMFKRMKKLTSGIAMIMILSFGFALPVSAAGTNSYVALGDSIAWGYNMVPYVPYDGYNFTGKGYPVLFYGQELSPSDSFNNLSNLGETSTSILQTINDNSADISNATILTLSVGSNNILGPIINTFATLYNVDPKAPNFEENLKNAMQANPTYTSTILAKLNNPYDQLTIMLKANLTAGVLKFNKDFPNILKSIRSKNKNSELYINTIYNPLKIGDPMYQSMNALVISMNTTIKFYAYLYNYKVVDVYQIVKNHSEYVPFSISELNFDVHPTADGQQAISDKLIDVRDNTWSYYWQKPIWALNY